MTGSGGMGRTFDIGPSGETETTVKMLQLGVLAGRVVDQFGDPIRNAIVRAVDRVDLPGADGSYEGFCAANTDDRGEYRIVEVHPGKHYVGVEYDSSEPSRSRGLFKWPEMGGYVFFPDAVEIVQAQELEVTAGGTTRVDDLVLKMRRAVKISGYVKPPPQGKTPALSVHRSGPNLGLNAFAIHGGGCESDGAFNVEVLPGRYVISAFDGKTGKTSPEVFVEAGDKDVTDIELSLSLSYEIDGRITVVGNEPLDFSKLMLNFMGGPVKIGTDGTFHQNAFGNTAAYVLQGLPEDWYIEKVLVAGLPIAKRQFSLRPGSTDLSIIVNPRGATLSVKAESAGTGFDAAGGVVLLPVNGPIPDVKSVLYSMPDDSGALVIHAVPPGSYRAFALGLTDALMVMRPDLLMEKYGKAAPLIHVSEGERKAIAVPLTKIQPE
jgi:hypothetical protein